MKKTCVFITGTNAVGKSTLAWAFITRYGGVDRITNDVTYCVEGSLCLAGKYGVTRYGGVDRITNERGSSCTSRLESIVREGLENADTIICEGSFMNTFGLNLTNALFVADHQLIVSLYADPVTLYSRLTERSEGRNGVRNYQRIIEKQKQAMIAARKYQSIGVPVLQFNTAEVTAEEMLEQITNKIKAICGKDMTNR